ncbi:MAG TPA: serine O-acetyltransferase [Verrucomicrobiae bacterium]|jgi:serine O-acetyltransferase|nr:serine O-acetyltransferase [Verrucomicrobiae bacterium]
MFEYLRQDYQRAYNQCGYGGKARRTLHTCTSAGFQAVAAYRASRWLMQKKIPLLGMVIQRVAEVWTGISIPPEASIGPGLLILHFGAIVIHGGAVIGSDFTLHHEVTIGNRVSGGRAPRIGDRVMVGVGAKVLGDITIGHDVQIGANAVVLDDVPDHAVAVGIPARVVRSKTPNKENS